jgi:peptidoglycan-associated lipoprotein
MHRVVIATLTLLAVACSSDKPAPQTAATASDPAPSAAQDSAMGEKPSAGKPTISDRIREACGINHADAYFGYNSAAVDTGYRTVLEQLATCFNDGPLKGESMKLVGHTDPRGEDEYNLVLGERRADGVRKALSKLGLAESRVSTTSRGEIEAKGSDEASWKDDRRVDVRLSH